MAGEMRSFNDVLTDSPDLLVVHISMKSAEEAQVHEFRDRAFALQNVYRGGTLSVRTSKEHDACEAWYLRRPAHSAWPYGYAVLDDAAYAELATAAREIEASYSGV